MSTKHLVALFAAAFALSLALTFPLSVALAWSGIAAVGLGARGISGSVWSGRLTEASLGGEPIGDVTAHLDLPSLLWAVPHLKLNAPQGAISLVHGAAHGIARATLRVPVRQLGLSIPLDGELQLDGATVLFRHGECVRASGQIAVQVSAADFPVPEMRGDLVCEGGAGLARLSGESAGAVTSIEARIAAGGTLELNTRIVTSDPVVQDTLSLAGFQERNGAFERSDHTQFGQFTRS